MVSPRLTRIWSLTNLLRARKSKAENGAGRPAPRGCLSEQRPWARESVFLSMEIEAIQFHDFVPSGYKVLDKLLLGVVLSIDLG